MFKLTNIKFNLPIYKIYKSIKTAINKELYFILYSTGIDSSNLLITFANIISKNYIALLHINHNINKLDNNYKNLCMKLSKQLEIKAYIININTGKKLFINENELRIKREKLIKILIKILLIKTIWTAHHKSDKKETYFIKAINNSAKFEKSKIFYESKNFYIEKKTPYKNIKKLYLKTVMKLKISWLEDTQNLTSKILRSIIRTKILPKLKFKGRCGWEVYSTPLLREHS